MLVSDGWLDTQVQTLDIQVQALSNLSPVFVHTLSNIGQSTKSVQTLDSQVQTLDSQVQTLDAQV